MRIVCLLLVLASTAAAQTTRYVDPAGTDVGDCSDPLNPCRTIVYTVAQSTDGDEIELSAGEFIEDGGIILDRDVAIRGQGREQTFVQEAVNVDGVDARVLDIPADVSVTIEHLTLRYGSGVDPTPPSDQIGGGLLRNAGTVAITDVTLTQGNHRCQSSWCGPGGAIRNRPGGTLILIDCDVVDNKSELGGGGGIYNEGEAIIENCTISDNEDIWQSSGGGIYNKFGATLTLINSSLSGNRAGDGGADFAHGGGLFNDGTATIIGGEIRLNTSGYGIFNDRGGHGGGIYNDGDLFIQGTVIADNETLSGSDPKNSGHARGAGIYNDTGNVLVISEASIVGNRTGSGDSENPGMCGNGGDGAGIFNAGSLTMTDTTIEDNITGDGGECDENTRGGHGGGLYSSGNATIDRTSIRQNETGLGYNLGGARGDGGGIHVAADGTLELNASTVNGNDGGRGGGIHTAGFSLIQNTTISANTSKDTITGPAHASGLLNIGELDLVASTITANDGLGNSIPGFSNQSFARLKGNIIADNIGLDCKDDNLNPPRGIESLGYNLIGRPNDDSAYGCIEAFPPGLPNANNDWVGTDAVPLDPLLGPLANNGGPTLTHALLEGSLAIDNGSCTDLNGRPIETDQRGYLRIAPCDIGAFELGGIVTASEPSATPDTHLLSLVYPNPFNPTARFTLWVEQSQYVSISLYDMVGREVSVLHDGVLAEDTLHEFEIDGTRLPSGIYFVVVHGEEFSGQLRVTLIK